ncbi:Dna-J like membrane chaperone protein [Rosistilla ulvae]|uniref:Dna-J like membrane chaperone protein n=1 Tax=Rosistilla ulvae TaxID=1930277 RepID=A0A517M6G6_9BACT|nr:TMEM43 family protein [Rosistilla ulvae]QDS90456.1 Dna-J like membrane chaperone protein [Rosistilla ulvae]
MARKEKSRWGGIVIGPVVMLAAMAALWCNETRYDYYKAAAKTTEVAVPDDAKPGANFSLTGSMDAGLTYPGKYVDSFTGYLTVARSAEIYCWDHDKDDDHDRWSMKWKSSVESNSRNSGVHQQCSSTSLHPPEYRVGELPVDSQLIEFVDGYDPIRPNALTLSPAGTALRLQPQGEYFYLSKNRSGNLGDERVRYTGIPVPALATYFGKSASGRGVADQSHQRTGFINQIIQDSGNLHYIVAGDRPTALASMKSHIQRLKWIVRGIGTAAVVIGMMILCSTFVGFLFHIPVIGSIAETGTFLISLLIGLPLALLTIASGYLASHPFILAAIAIGIVAIIYWIRQRGQASQQILKQDLDQQYGHQLGYEEMKDLEFLELAQLAFSDAKLDAGEAKVLSQWARKQGWDKAKCDAMIKRAKENRATEAAAESNDDHLQNLIRLAMADGSLSNYEIRTIRKVSKQIGYDDQTIREMIDRVRRGIATPTPA